MPDGYISETDGTNTADGVRDIGIADESKLETVTFSAESSSRSLERVRG